MSITQQPDALNLEEFRAKVTHAAREPLLARIAELEAQLSTIGAGGVEPLRKQAVPHTKVKADFRWDSENQHHIPTLLIEFEPVPAGEPCDAKGWTDRDNLAAMLAAAPQPPAAAPVELPMVPQGYRLQPLSEYDAMCAFIAAAQAKQKEQP